VECESGTMLHKLKMYNLPAEIEWLRWVDFLTHVPWHSTVHMMINFRAAIGSNCVTYQQVLNYFLDLSPVLLHKSNKINLTCSIRGTKNAASMLQVVSEVGSRWWTWSLLHFPPNEAYFHLHGHVISQNSQYRSSVNPQSSSASCKNECVVCSEC
jgi:hypothetical protein